MFMIAGTVKQSVKLAQMNQAWLEKKEKGILKKEKELTPQERQLEMFREQVEQNREASKYAGIGAKIESGGTLTAEEIDFLKKNNPEALRRYEQMKAEKKAYERQLENCKTKDEVERLKLQKVGGFLAAAKKISSNACIPKAQKMALLQEIIGKLSNIHKAHIKFVNSTRYQNLPTDEELAEEKRERIKELTGTEEAISAEKKDTGEEATAEQVLQKDTEATTESAGQVGTETMTKVSFQENTEASTKPVSQEKQKVDFDTALRTVQDSIKKLESDTYDRSGDGACFEPEKALGKRIDSRR